MRKRIFCVSLVISMLLSFFGFAEDYSTHWANEEITYLMEKGIILGDADGIRPDDVITRAEFAKVINKNFGFREIGENIFLDVNEKDWFYQDILIAVKAGYLKGDSNQLANPNAILTRQEACVVYARLLKLDVSDTDLDFADKIQVPAWAKGSVKALVKLKIINGYGDNTFRGNTGITRAEVFSTVVRLERKALEDSLPSIPDNTGNSSISLGGHSGSGGGGSGSSGGGNSGSTSVIPEIPIINAVNSGTRTVRWKSVLNAVEYAVKVVRTTNGVNTEKEFRVKENYVDLVDCTVEMLKNGKVALETFQVAVKSIGRKGESAFSDFCDMNITFNTVGVPNDLRVETIMDEEENETIIVCWSEVPDAKEYRISIEFDGIYVPLTVTGTQAVIPSEKFASMELENNVQFETVSGNPDLLDSPVLTKKLKMPLYGGGEGTKKDPYLISNERHFHNIARDPASNYKIIKDIKLAKIVTIPEFSGSLIGDVDGRAAELTIHYNPEDSPQADGTKGGLFTKLYNATVENIGIAGKFTAGVSSGTLASRTEGATVKNCYNAAEINITSGSLCGGLIGSASNSSVITGCYNKGIFRYTGSGLVYHGGVLGYMSAASVINCWNAGDLDSASGQIAGVVGALYSGTLTGAYNSGTVKGASAAGIFGMTSGDQNIMVSSVFNSGTVTATGVASAIGLDIASKGGLKKLDEAYNIGTVSGAKTACVYSTVSDYNPATGSGCLIGDEIYSVNPGKAYTVNNPTVKEITADQLSKMLFPSKGLEVDSESSYRYPKLPGYPYMAKPKKLSNPVIENVIYDGETVLLHFMADMNATKNKIEIYQDNILIDALLTKENSVDILSSLNGYGDYVIQVTSLGDNGYLFENSGVTSYTYTHKKYTVPGPTFAEVIWSNEGQEAYKVCWNPIQDPCLEGYNVYVYDNTGVNLVDEVHAQKNTDYLLAEGMGVLFGDDYKVCVEALFSDKDPSTTSEFHIPTKYAGGKGTEAEPYGIALQRHFENMKDSHAYFTLKEDVDIDSTYQPFRFNGKLLGNNKTVTVNIFGDVIAFTSQEHKNVGLFSELYGSALVQDLVIDGTVRGYGLVGALAGNVSEASVTVKNVTNRADVQGIGNSSGWGDKYYIGGIFGKATGSHYSYLRNEGNISGSYYVAGIVGQSYALTLKDCSNVGNVTARGEGVAGIVAYFDGSSVIQRCYNTGEISAKNIAGGIAAMSAGTNSSISNCYHTGNVTVQGAATYCGGILGLANASRTINVKACYSIGQALSPIASPVASINPSSCYYLSKEETDAYDGTTALSEQQMKDFDNFKGFDHSIWNTEDGYDYPQLMENPHQ
ncbi:S-layer homology domain-containing protein [Acetivibrio sp. MSJd-27]|uniref:S-layer homology domain-containing protein n=1 Tax=Acetivibrio sp. MSJd-27 TaxID=2841523 RepID=UPI001C12689E|nr:S-layer homology domain-containing protein [Acetivibrio sp. MSJd-27]MBU5451003.1 S-layer homology domain-containing protein [Acetivibrio sp. MSJd-27]